MKCHYDHNGIIFRVVADISAYTCGYKVEIDFCLLGLALWWGLFGAYRWPDKKWLRSWHTSQYICLRQRCFGKLHTRNLCIIRYREAITNIVILNKYLQGHEFWQFYLTPLKIFAAITRNKWPTSSSRPATRMFHVDRSSYWIIIVKLRC